MQRPGLHRPVAGASMQVERTPEPGLGGRGVGREVVEAAETPDRRSRRHPLAELTRRSASASSSRSRALASSTGSALPRMTSIMSAYARLNRALAISRGSPSVLPDRERLVVPAHATPRGRTASTRRSRAPRRTGPAAPVPAPSRAWPSLEARPRLVQVAALLPEPPQREGQVDRDVPGRGRPTQSRAARRLSWSRSSRSSQRRWSSPRAGAAPPSSASARTPRRGGRAIGRRASPPVASISAAYSRIVSSIAKRGSSGSSSRRTRLWSSELADPIDDVAADLVGRPGHDASAIVSVEAAAEDRQPVEQPARPVVEQVVAPGDRPAQGLLALREVARAGGQRRPGGGRAGPGSGRASGA